VQLLVAALASAEAKLEAKKHSRCGEFLVKMQGFGEVLLKPDLVPGQQIHINVPNHFVRSYRKEYVYQAI
jgi:hypothetical protein